MRKVTQQASEAFMNALNFKSGNTQVIVKNWDKGLAVGLYLHGNLIAERFTSANVLKITNCDYFTNTTKERLNSLPNVSIQQKAGIWYLNGKEWNGELITVN